MGDEERWRWSSAHPAYAGLRAASWLLKLEGDEVSLGSRIVGAYLDVGETQGPNGRLGA